MNTTIIIGNLTKDPELRTTQNGISTTSFTVAVQRRFKTQDGNVESDFIPVITWRGIADNCAKFLFKGSKVAVSGSIQTRNYEDKNGVRHYITEIIADNVEFLTQKGQVKQPQAEQPQQSELSIIANDFCKDDFAPIDDGDLPF